MGSQPPIAGGPPPPMSQTDREISYATPGQGGMRRRLDRSGGLAESVGLSVMAGWAIGGAIAVPVICDQPLAITGLPARCAIVKGQNKMIRRAATYE